MEHVCEKCGAKQHLIKVKVNGTKMILCADCVSSLEHVKKLGITFYESDKKTKYRKTLYFKILHPEYFANADRVMVSYGIHDKDDLENIDWSIRAKLDLIAPLLHLKKDSELNYLRLTKEYLLNDTSPRHQDACQYFNSLVEISEKEYEDILASADEEKKERK